MENYLIELMRKYILPGFLLLVLVSCGEETNMSGGIIENYRPIDVSVKMKVEDYQDKDVTKAGSPLPGDLGNAENVINDITVFQFDGEGEETAPLVVLRYVDAGFDNLKLGLMQPKSDRDKKQLIYFIANAGEQLQDFTGTYADLKCKLISVNNAGISDGIIVMTFSLVTRVDATSDITVKFSRRIAKINVTCSIASGVSFTPARLQLRNVPKSFTLVSSSTPVPMASADNFQNYLSITDNIQDGYTWYMPENRRGRGSANTPNLKTAATAPSGQGGYCTYVELSGLYQENGTSKLVSYRVYLGNNNTDDYNVENNRVYNVHLSVSGVNEADQRLTVETLPEPKIPANCYMVSPGTTVVIDMLKSPGKAVSGSGIDYTSRVGDSSNPLIKSVGIVWQTADTPDGLIQDLTYLAATGQAMFKVTPGASGNLLLAAYSDTEQKGTVLWSWHIWITDYRPDEYVAENTSVTGGNVYSSSRDGGIWMDRDLGALTATPGSNTTIGYAYQWGRKDPFPLSNDVAAVVLRPLYDSKGEYLRSGAVTEIHNSGEKDLIEKAIAYPWIFFTTTEGADDMTKGYWWKTTESLFLWSDTEKTMYDPCPAGWRLPSSTIVNKVNGATMSRNDKLRGSYYNKSSLWFQYCGYMSYLDGTIGQPGATSVYWSSKLYTMYQHTPSNVGQQPRHGGFGFIGRCVKE